MYTYSAGSPGTFSGPSLGSYLQEGRRLSYAPRFSGLGTSELYAAGSPGTFRGLGTSELYAAGSPGTFRHYGAEAGEGSGQATGGGWADVINAAITGVATIWQMDTQRRLIKQQQHQAEREAAAARQNAQTQALYLRSQSIKPAQGSHVTVANGGGAVRRAGIGLGAVALLGAAGVGAYLLLGRKRRRRNPRRRRRRR